MIPLSVSVAAFFLASHLLILAPQASASLSPIDVVGGRESSVLLDRASKDPVERAVLGSATTLSRRASGYTNPEDNGGSMLTVSTESGL